MVIDTCCFKKIFVCCSRQDLRKGIDGLAAPVNQHFKLNPFEEGTLFLFCRCRQDRFKGLVWCGDGFLLMYRRIEAGRLQWPRDQNETARITPEQLRDLLSGFVILQKSTIRTPDCSGIA